jgi:hypothetical protein
VLARFSGVLALMKSLKPILYAGALVGVLDITAACINARIAYGFPPARVLKGVASGLLGRAALEGGFATAALGLMMHLTMALTVATIFYALIQRFPLPRKLSAVVAVGLFYERRFLWSTTSAQRHFCRGFAVSICIHLSCSSPRWAGHSSSFTCSAWACQSRW